MNQTKQTPKEAMYQRIEQHGRNLNAIFNTGFAPITLCKKLLRLENKAHKLAVDYCNGENGVNSDNWESKYMPILDSLDRILNFRKQGIPILINGDARGYALKLRDDFASHVKIYRDMGGYGILAPDLTNN